MPSTTWRPIHVSGADCPPARFFAMQASLPRLPSLSIVPSPDFPLPVRRQHRASRCCQDQLQVPKREKPQLIKQGLLRSEEHTSELQSRQYLVCRLLLEKKKNIINDHHPRVI